MLSLAGEQRRPAIRHTDVWCGAYSTLSCSLQMAPAAAPDSRNQGTFRYKSSFIGCGDEKMGEASE